MHKLSSGVLAVLIFTAGMAWSCSDSSEKGVSPDSPNDGDPPTTISQSSDDSHGDSSAGDLSSTSDGKSSGTDSVSSSSSGGNISKHSSSSIKSPPNENSSSSTNAFTYTAPENFSDTVNGAIFDMVYVAGGSYTRGCDNCAEQDKIYESPSHKVTVNDYHIAPTEVTIGQWNAIMGGKKSAWESDKAPKIGVSWFDANNFACKLTQKTGRQYRLLTDAEWEFAARGGKDGVSDKFKFSGSNNIDDVAWYSENSGGKSHDVATKKPNKLGLYDMSGNSWEWVYDWLAAYTSSDKTNPVQLTGSGNKTRRGGSYGEPAEFARVSRRAIRSRDGAADMGFRIGMSSKLPPGMATPCEAANPSVAVCNGEKNRDCRLITNADEAWISDDYTVIIGEDGTAAVSGYPNISGQWYTLNNRSFNVVTRTGTKTYAYYIFSEDELTMISDDGIPYRLYKRSASEAKNKISLPTVSNPKTLSQLIDAVEPERLVSDEQILHPDTSIRDKRIAAESGYTWFFDGRCCGGNHKYRFHLDKNGDAEFVVMDYDDTHHENILAKGRWFTVGNIGLHIVLNGKYYNYLYTVGERTMSYSEYMPAGPIFCHISFQSYERGDFRIFNKTVYDDKIKRPRGFNGENPVYEAGDYQWGSESAHSSKDIPAQSSSSSSRSNVSLDENGFATVADVYKSLAANEKAVFIIRHSEREDDVSMETELTANGIKMAQDLGKTLKSSEDFSYITSGFVRTNETANNISKGRGESSLPKLITNYDITGNWFLKISADSLAKYATSLGLKGSSVELMARWAYDGEYPEVFYDLESRAKEFMQTVILKNLRKWNRISIMVSHDIFVMPLAVFGSQKNVALKYHKDYHWINFIAGLAVIISADNSLRYIPIKGADSGIIDYLAKYKAK
ncbi:MAG: SUMF1/EgtB/PvdO family nonheme iron enzyme [Fibrobacter sp.]|nr:SUMF1/EgtB/PvdO family nonheme iron enzyme [Fibrobacter sp.]